VNGLLESGKLKLIPAEEVYCVYGDLWMSGYLELNKEKVMTETEFGAIEEALQMEAILDEVLFMEAALDQAIAMEADNG
jgi:hypothetical protein